MAFVERFERPVRPWRLRRAETLDRIHCSKCGQSSWLIRQRQSPEHGSGFVDRVYECSACEHAQTVTSLRETTD